MTAKEKAEELVDTYRNAIMSFLSDNMKHQNAKTCAIITVDKIINELKEICEYKSYDPFEAPVFQLEYYKEVKAELLKDHWSTTSGVYQGPN